MSVRCLFFGKYTPESIKGIMGGSDRMAAVKAVVEAAGGTVNMVSFHARCLRCSCRHEFT